MKIKNIILLFAIILYSLNSNSQDQHYIDSIQSFQQSYVKNHGVVKGKDKEYLRFFPVKETSKVPTRFEKIEDAPWFNMETSANQKQVYRVYGILHFNWHDTLVKLHVYQSERLMKTKEYAEHLFIPFTDLSTGEESYENGRYIDLSVKDLESNNYILDFNRAYNPYCAYISNQYSCPIPPKENDLPVKITAGEMKFGKEK